MRRLNQRKAWSGGTIDAGRRKVVVGPCPVVPTRLRLHPGAAPLRVRAVVEEPHGAAGGPGGGPGGSRPARASSLRWARRQRVLACEPLLGAGEDDLLELNVGGKLMQTTRSTLRLVPGSRLAAMFRRGGEGQLSYDSSGRVWLDWDPGLFQLVLRYLREAKMNGGHRRDCLPAVQPADEAPFRRLLLYLGVMPYGGNTIPIVLGHDPLTDEPLPPPPQPLTPHAAAAATVGAAPTSPSKAAAAAARPPARTSTPESCSSQEHLHVGLSDGEPSLRETDGPSAAAASSGQKRAEGEAGGGVGSGSKQGAVRRSRGAAVRRGGASAVGRDASSLILPSPGAAAVASAGLVAGTGTPAPSSAGADEARQDRAGSCWQLQPRQHSRQQQEQPLPEPALESEDFIPDTATCSILGSGRSTLGSSSSSSRSSSGIGGGVSAGSVGSRPGPASHTPYRERHQQQQQEQAGPQDSDDYRWSRSAGGRPAGRPATGGPANASHLPPARRGDGSDGCPSSDRPLTRLSPPPVRAVPGVSQLFYISTDYSESRGLRVSVHTEDDVRAAAAAAAQAPTVAAGGSTAAAAAAGGQAAEPFDIFVDTTYGDGQISLTFVSRRELLPGGVFLGLTSRSQLDRKGAQIPCYGWKSNGCTYNDHTGGGRLGDGGGGGAAGVAPRQGGPAAAAPETDLAAVAAAEACRVLRRAEGGGSVQPGLSGPYGDPLQTLWRKGDSVELIMRQGQHHNQLLLKVNGQAIDVINRLPSFRNWSWYVGLWAGGDISCAVFQRDQYAVYWGDYAVKRYL